MLIGAALLLISAGVEAAPDKPAAPAARSAVQDRSLARPCASEKMRAGSQASLSDAARTSDYSRREEAAKDLGEFRGGREVEVVYVSGLAVLVVALIILIIIL
jgi:hypothetical protein